MRNEYRVSNDKSSAVYFHRKRGLEYQPMLQLNNKNIAYRKEVKFVGLYLEQRLRFKEHVEYLR